MQCPNCKSENVVCVDSRYWRKNKHRRRRKCLGCGERFPAVEICAKEYDNLLYRVERMTQAAKAMLDIEAEYADEMKG